ncbi:MAG: hypothetical protein ACRDO2_09230 [Nocardioidaceae bacterium]
MLRFNRAVVITAAFAAATVAGVSPASAGPQGDYFIVDTQFIDAPSDIVEAGGAFADCTQVLDLGGIAEQIGPRKELFIGDKLVQCASGEVVIHYNAEHVFGHKKTHGHWFVVESTVPGITEGFGTVRGDGSRCEVAEGSGGCILDVFAGTVG